MKIKFYSHLFIPLEFPHQLNFRSLCEIVAGAEGQQVGEAQDLRPPANADAHLQRVLHLQRTIEGEIGKRGEFGGHGDGLRPAEQQR